MMVCGEMAEMDLNVVLSLHEGEIGDVCRDSLEGDNLKMKIGRYMCC